MLKQIVAVANYNLFGNMGSRKGGGGGVAFFLDILEALKPVSPES